MLLAIDAGNTNTVFAICRDDTVLHQWRIATQETRTGDEYLVWFEQLLTRAGLSVTDLSACIIASVVPQAQFNLRQFAERHVGVEPLVVGEPDVDLGLEVRLSEPSGVGADRLANAVGAHIKYEGALIVIDFGTATTFDIVAADGAYEGGVIAPGVNLSTEALHMAAAKLPHVTIERPARVIGKNTVEAMKSGMFWGYVSMIEGVVKRIKAEFGAPMRVIATGGLSKVFAHDTPLIEHVDENLTVNGLCEIYRRNSVAPSTGRRPQS